MNSQDMIDVLRFPRYVPRPKPLAIPSADLTENPRFALIVNSEWAEHLLGLLQVLDQPDAWLGSDSEIDAARQNVEQMRLMLMTPYEDFMYPQHVTLWHDEAIIESGGALTSLSLAPAPYNILGQFYNLITYQSSIADGDTFMHYFSAEAGDYNFEVLGGKNAYGGKLDWFLDDETTAFETGQDFYNSTELVNVRWSFTLNISHSGNHVLRGVVNGHTSPSGAYFIPLVKYWLNKA